MLERYRRVLNRSDAPHDLVDHGLPGGRITLRPGEETQIPVEVYHRQFRRHASWLTNVDSPTYQPPQREQKRRRNHGRRVHAAAAEG